jgi:ketosteroid isomerase-like protein
MSEPDSQILQVLETYKASVFAKDVDAFLALYDEKARIFDMWEKWSYDTRADWRGMVVGWFGSLGTDRDVVDFSEVQTLVAGDVAFAHAFVGFKAVSADGKVLRGMVNRISLVLARKGAAWKIVHQHTSAPLDGTTKAIFQR